MAQSIIRVFPDALSLAVAAAEAVASAGSECVASRGRFDLVLSGGRTPEAAYAVLARRMEGELFLWGRTHLWWGDERRCPPDDPESNFHLARRTLIDEVPVRPAGIHRIRAESPDPSRAADDYARDFPAAPSVMLLGMGADGHTASLFPGSPALEERDRLFVPAEAPVDPQGRITATPRAIASAERLIVLVSGGAKAECMVRVFDESGSVRETPARLARGATWFADRAAAERVIELAATERGINISLEDIA
jgi:6-phosphogluconolactonase